MAIVVQMQIFVKNLGGGGYLTFKVKSSDKVVTLKEQILDKTMIPVHDQRLIFSTEQLDDDKTLANYNIQKESIIELLLRLLGD